MPNPQNPILTTFQIELLNRLGKSPLREAFFLTGGTALAACYLHHRLSEDLDFFTGEPGRIRQVPPVLESLVKDHGYGLKISRQFSTFLEVFITSPEGETIKADFAEDAPYRLQPLEKSPWNMKVDNPLDIACNKLSALFERAAAKDFVDLYFIAQKLYPLEDLLPQAQKKHVGLDAYWLAIAFQHVEKIEKWPVMKLPCDFSALTQFFLTKARGLLRTLE
jgi:hypothetical protein